ncbi:MAG: DsbA family protein [Oceanidesulfovibrio sp.]
MRKLTALCLAAIISCLVAAGCSENPAADKTDLEREISDILREKPDLVLNILRENNETVFRIAQQGMAEAQQRALEEQRMAMVENPLQPEINMDRPVRGPEDAPIVIVEYSDFQCPYCSDAARTVELLMQKHKDEVRLHFKHMPLSSHPVALPAARYFEAASLQDEEKAWQLYDIFFSDQEALKQGGVEWIRQQATELGLDVDKLDEDAAGSVVNNRIKDDLREAKRLDITGTPHFIVGGVLVAGAQPLEEFSKIIELIKDHRANQGSGQSGAETNTTKDQDS